MEKFVSLVVNEMKAIFAITESDEVSNECQLFWDEISIFLMNSLLQPELKNWLHVFVICDPQYHQ